MTTLTDTNIELCIDCNNFSGHTNKKCSVCVNPSHPLRNSIVKSQSLLIQERDEMLDRWIGTGIHSYNNTIELCAICLEEKQPNELISNFACACNPFTCVKCNEQLNMCPICKEGKYLKIGEKEIKIILENNFSNKSILNIVQQAIANNYPSPFKLTQVVCFAHEIDKVLRNFINQGRCFNINAIHSIYCLSPDFVRSKSEHHSSIICYKGFGEHTKYTDIIKVRKWTDMHKLMCKCCQF